MNYLKKDAMVKCKQFTDIYNEVINLGGTHEKREDEYPISTGTILGYNFRMFQEYETLDMKGPSKTFVAYISIDDENSKENKWTTFYSANELQTWYITNNHKNL